MSEDSVDVEGGDTSDSMSTSEDSEDSSSADSDGEESAVGFSSGSFGNGRPNGRLRPFGAFGGGGDGGSRFDPTAADMQAKLDQRCGDFDPTAADMQAKLDQRCG